MRKKQWRRWNNNIKNVEYKQKHGCGYKFERYTVILTMLENKEIKYWMLEIEVVIMGIILRMYQLWEFHLKWVSVHGENNLAKPF